MNFRKISYFILANLIFSLVLNAQIPAGYYDSATGSGYTLKTQLHNIIDNHTVVSYDALWTHFQSTDVDNYYENDSSPLDMYSENPSGSDPYNWTFVSDQCGNYSGEASCYNREHSFPKSWFNDASPMYSDIFHLYLTDGYVNGRRSNWPFGEVSAPTWTSLNGSKVGPCSYPGYTGTVFEPLDEFKGDFARTYFYMATRYEDIITGWSSAILNGTSDQVYTDWHLNMLIEWHTNDPVSQKEIDRNNIIYVDVQHNRNPFIDNPNYVYQIWGGTPVPSINFVTASQQIGENIGTLTVYLSISESIPETVTANLVLTGTAADPDDYTISTTNIFFPASSTGNQSAVLTIEDDLIPEDFETIILTIDNLTTSNPDIVIGSNSEITVTINNSDGFDETPPEVDTFEVLNDSTFILTFSEQVDPVTSQLESNYIVNNGVGSPSSAVLGYLGDSAKVELSYPAALLSGSYQLTINNVEDLKSNVIALNTTVDFGISSGPGDGWIEPFEEDTNYGGSYYVGTVTFPSGDWEFDSVFIEGTVDTPYEGVQSIRLKDGTADASLTTPYINGVDSVSFYYRSYRADISMFILQKSVNGGPFENITTQAYSETSYNQFSYKVNENSDNIRIRILNDSQPERLCVDYFKVVTFSGPVQDTSPPEILTHAVTDSTLIITFSEILDPSTSQTVGNYVLDNGAGNPSAAVLGYGGDSAVVEIFYPAFLTDTNYQLTISNVEDTAANPMVTDNIDFIINSGGSGGGEGWIEPFEEDTNWGGSYYVGTVTFPSGDWDFNYVFLEGPVDTPYEGVQSVRLKDGTADASLTTPYINGVDSISFYYRSYRADTSLFIVQKSVNNGPFENITTQAYSQTTYDLFSYKVDDPSDNVRIRILNDNQPERLCIDYFKVVQFPSEPPSAPANVTTQISGSDIILSWDAVPGATGYDVYSSDSPYDGFGWEASVTESSYTTPYTEARKFYYIVAKTTAKSLKSGESHERFIEIR
jgi:endonuclease I